MLRTISIVNVLYYFDTLAPILHCSLTEILYNIVLIYPSYVKKYAFNNFLFLGVYFVVQLGTDQMFPANSIIQLDDVKENVGGGYINDTTNADYGKFIAPVGGTYQFIVTIMNKYSAKVYGDLMVNGVIQSSSFAGQKHLQTVMAATVVNLNVGDMVWVKGHHSATYRAKGFMSFFGHLIHADLKNTS